ncbi:MAG: sugar phosphate isomerase/epimerase [Ruminococcaceae bacterium]|nr:sugar phosphate isomerase/epimerase [Oscillospiraceae bacterium]
MKLGVLTDCFKEGVERGIELAGELGFNGVQIYATNGVFSADGLDKHARAKYKKLLKDKKLEISALCGDMGGYGYQIAADNPLRIEKTKRIIDIAEDFETKVVTTHIGVIPSDKSEERYAVMLDALTKCGLYAQTRGVTLAIETGPESAKVLLDFINGTNGGVGVNLDPANFVMVTGQDPVEAVELLGKYIVHTHVKDGKMLIKTDPKIIYDCFAVGGIEGLNVADYFEELPVGTGDVDFPAYLAALKKVGYNGYLTIEREAGVDRLKDIAGAKAYIENIINN